MPEIKERPILFSAPMVRAILEGRKTVTRRAINPQPKLTDGSGFSWKGYLYGAGSDSVETARNFARPCSPYGQPGDRIWVRESFWHAGDWVATYPEDDTGSWSGTRRVHYRADGEPPNEPNHHYPSGLKNGSFSAAAPAKLWRARPSIHMPRWASRILLEITAVRVERLQDGEGETAHDSRYIAEGINRIHHGDGQHYYHAFKNEPGLGNWVDPFDAWRELWVEVNGADSWNANPWVWVVEFQRVAL